LLALPLLPLRTIRSIVPVLVAPKAPDMAQVFLLLT